MIEVGEYVRTKKGTIRKAIKVFISIIVADKSYIEDYCITEAISKRDIVKHSKNLIDLIKVGDILSLKYGCIVRVEDIQNNYFLLKDYAEEFYERKEIVTDEIKSIVTSEQFKSIEYRLED